ncbi:MAG: glycine betaine ABC transporter substrate-binding protein [Deinococcota bacterium]
MLLVIAQFAWAQPVEPETPAQANLTCPLTAPVQLGAYAWQTSQLVNAIVSYLLSEGYGCNVEQHNGLPEALELALVRGELDLLLGVSSQQASAALTTGLTDGTLTQLASLYQRQDGFYISRDLLLAIRPPQDGIASPEEPLSIADFATWLSQQTSPATDATNTTDTANSTTPDVTLELPAAFQQLAFVNCSTSWSCYDTNLAKLAAYDLSTAVLAPASAGEVVSSLQTAQEGGTPWFGFAWSPSWLVHTYDLVRLEEPPFSEDCWQSDQACNYPADVNLTVTTARFAEQLPEELTTLLSNIQFEAGILSDLLSHNQGGGVSADETRDYFLRTYPEVWQAWLTVDAAARVQTSLEATSP